MREENRMPGKRSRFKKKQMFSCPHCQQQLWRVGSPKYYLFYQGKAEIQKGFNLSAKNASFLANQQDTCVDLNVWLEEFFCETDGQIWMHLSQNEQKAIASRLATAEDWQRTTKTFDPDKPHSSVSEFTLRMSRGHYNNLKIQAFNPT
jgi:hypothetical protein